jgi:lipid-A-disaccharide synthase
MLDTAKIIYGQKPEAQFLILRSESVKQEIFQKITSRYRLPVSTLSGMTYNGLNASDFAIVASGTATLETAILGIPMVIIYKVSFLTWAYLKLAIKIPYIGLVNVIRQEKFIAEFIQYAACPAKIGRYILGILQDETRLKNLKQGLLDTAKLLGEKGASIKAAFLTVELLDKT